MPEDRNLLHNPRLLAGARSNEDLCFLHHLPAEIGI
jgi:hypothetical protein